MSHHFDSPTAIADGRLNLCDVYVFAGPGSTSNLILTVNPDAGRSSATTFRSDALYEFVIAGDASTNADRAFRMTFTGPAPDGRQQMTVRYAEGVRPHAGIADGLSLGTGATAEVHPLTNGGSAWFGEVGDPFWGDGLALAQFMQGLAADEYHPELFAASPEQHLRRAQRDRDRPPGTEFDVGRGPSLTLGTHQPLRSRADAAGKPNGQPDGAPALLLGPRA